MLKFPFSPTIPSDFIRRFDVAFGSDPLAIAQITDKNLEERVAVCAVGPRQLGVADVGGLFIFFLISVVLGGGVLLIERRVYAQYLSTGRNAKVHKFFGGERVEDEDSFRDVALKNFAGGN
jgi:hypothetical protein